MASFQFIVGLRIVVEIRRAPFLGRVAFSAGDREGTRQKLPSMDIFMTLAAPKRRVCIENLRLAAFRGPARMALGTRHFPMGSFKGEIRN